jgi:hypothetical protein
MMFVVAAACSASLSTHFRRYISDGGEKCLLRLTMFRAKYGKNGELVAVPLGFVIRMYLVSRYCHNHDVSAIFLDVIAVTRIPRTESCA